MVSPYFTLVHILQLPAVTQQEAAMSQYQAAHQSQHCSLHGRRDNGNTLQHLSFAPYNSPRHLTEHPVMFFAAVSFIPESE